MNCNLNRYCMEKETTTSVTITRNTFNQLDRLAKANGVSKKEFLSCALDYFEKYGINPVQHESPAQEMQKLIKRCDQVIAFIRKQEQDFLRPACEAMNQTKMQVALRMDQILSEQKFKMYLERSNEFVRQMSVLAGVRGNNVEALSRQIEESEKNMMDALLYIASFVDAKGKTGLLDDLKRNYEDAKEKKGLR